jgi:hypothetical protein
MNCVLLGNSKSDEEVGLLSHKATIWEPFFNTSEHFEWTGMNNIKSIKVFKIIHDEYDKSEGEQFFFYSEYKLLFYQIKTLILS